MRRKKRLVVGCIEILSCQLDTYFHLQVSIAVYGLIFYISMKGFHTDDLKAQFT